VFVRFLIICKDGPDVARRRAVEALPRCTRGESTRAGRLKDFAHLEARTSTNSSEMVLPNASPQAFSIRGISARLRFPLSYPACGELAGKAGWTQRSGAGICLALVRCRSETRDRFSLAYLIMKESYILGVLSEPEAKKKAA
jgi:hypothetical protein